MSFTGMSIQGDLGRIGSTQTDIYNGNLFAASKDYGGFFSTQTSYDSPIVLSMFLSSDNDYRDLKIHADSLHIRLEGDFKPEHIWDQDGNIKAIKDH
jgi:hypothetical protein